MIKKSKKLSCLLLINESGLEGGGAEKRIELLVKCLIERKTFDRILFLHSSEQTKHNKNSRLGNLKIPGTVEFKPFYYKKDERSSDKLVKQIIRKFTPDIIQFHNIMNLGVLKAIIESKIPTIFVAHDYWPICGKRHFIDPYNARNKRLCYNPDVFKCIPCIGIRSYLKTRKIQKFMNKVSLGIAPAKITKNIYENHNVLADKWEIITPWIDTLLFKPKEDTRRNNDILFVGSLLDYKGAWIIADAFVKISKAVHDSRLLFIGPSQEKRSVFRKRIEKIAEKEGVIDRVLFLGPKKWWEIVEYHRKCGVYVCPPIWPEVFGLNWAEAMASGCPVVASRIGGIPELLGKHGILVKPRNSEELADAVIKILRDKKLAERMSKEGSRMALSRFDVKRACDKFILLYASLTNRIK